MRLVASVVVFTLYALISACSPPLCEVGEHIDHSLAGASCLCAGRLMVCGSSCEDPTTVAHCGACGHTCPLGSPCVDGVCLCDAPNETACDAACVDLDTHADHCGACGAACRPGEVCVDGACGCPPELTDCGDGCFDLLNSASHCGSCDRSCGGGCTGGGCDCFLGGVACEGHCSDEDHETIFLSSDEDNCGDCGLACAEGEHCVDGHCGCYADEAYCDGACVDVLDNEDACGACDNVCLPGELCHDGACLCLFDRCESSCTRLSADVENCGACDIACRPGETCEDGVCTCDGVLCGDICVDLETDRLHCGGCGVACPAGQVCVGGECGCRGDTRLCDAACEDSHCETDAICFDGECSCFDGWARCGAWCVDILADSEHCGGCGIRCLDGDRCESGICGCDGIRCEGQCTDPWTHPDHCGGCGIRCADWELCHQGVCAVGVDEAMGVIGESTRAWDSPFARDFDADGLADHSFDRLLADTEVELDPLDLSKHPLLLTLDAWPPHTTERPIRLSAVLWAATNDLNHDGRPDLSAFGHHTTRALVELTAPTPIAVFEGAVIGDELRLDAVGDSHTIYRVAEADTEGPTLRDLQLWGRVRQTDQGIISIDRRHHSEDAGGLSLSGRTELTDLASHVATAVSAACPAETERVRWTTVPDGSLDVRCPTVERPLEACASALYACDGLTHPDLAYDTDGDGVVDSAVLNAFVRLRGATLADPPFAP